MIPIFNTISKACLVFRFPEKNQCTQIQFNRILFTYLFPKRYLYHRINSITCVHYYA